MSSVHGYLVQAELFHVDSGSGPQKFAEDLQERLSAEAAIKTVVRFLVPSDDPIIVRARELDFLPTQEQLLTESILNPETAWHKAWIQRWILRRVSQRRIRLKKELMSLVVKAVERQLHVQNALGIEGRRHQFRLVHPDERHELLHTLRRLPGDLWLFVFAASDLVADVERKKICAVF